MTRLVLDLPVRLSVGHAPGALTDILYGLMQATSGHWRGRGAMCDALHELERTSMPRAAILRFASPMLYSPK